MSAYNVYGSTDSDNPLLLAYTLSATEDMIISKESASPLHQLSTSESTDSNPFCTTPQSCVGFLAPVYWMDLVRILRLCIHSSSGRMSYHRSSCDYLRINFDILNAVEVVKSNPLLFADHDEILAIISVIRVFL